MYAEEGARGREVSEDISGTQRLLGMGFPSITQRYLERRHAALSGRTSGPEYCFRESHRIEDGEIELGGSLPCLTC